MGLKEIVGLLIDESISRYTRAITLFEFQTAVYRPKAFDHLIKANEVGLRAPTKILRTARIFAAIKILEKIEADLRQERADSVISLRDLAANEDYRSVFDDVIATNGGWTRIRHSQSARTFDRSMKARKEKARAAAGIVDFSFRFFKNPASTQYPGRKNPGGVEAARYVVRISYEPQIGKKTTIKGRWREYQVSAVFVYLLLNQGFDLGPPRVGSKEFVEVLMRQVEDIAALRSYFTAYKIVRCALSKLGYKKFPPLDLVLGCSTQPQLNAPEFCPKVKAAFDEWLKGGDLD
jgi:hypothetical protein